MGEIKQEARNPDRNQKSVSLEADQESGIRYLSQEEKGRTRVLYETCFPEDSPAFVDYYYTNRILDNRILVLEQEGQTGQIRPGKKEPERSSPQVMIHLNPYRCSICGQEAEVSYLVAVATDQAARRQGKMSRVLEMALRDLAGEGKPFAFLIPANPRVYRSSGFAFIPTEQYGQFGMQQAPIFAHREEIREQAPVFARREEIREQAPVIAQQEEIREQEPALKAAELKREPALKAAELEQEPGFGLGKSDAEKAPAKGERMFFLKKATMADIPRIAAFSKEFLEREYDVSLRKTQADYKRMFAELESENGAALLLLEASGKERDAKKGKRPELYGFLSYGKEDGVLELKDLLVSGTDRETVLRLLKQYFPHEKIKIPEMKFMVRILDLQKLVPLLKSEREISRRIRVEDNIIPENQGCFWIRVGREGGGILPIPEEEAEETVNIGELAEQLFGGLKTCIREWV